MDTWQLKKWWLWKYLQCKPFVSVIVIAHIKEKDKTKYLVFDSTDEKQRSIKKVYRTLGLD